MLKISKTFILRTMSTNKRSKQTLAKKLSAKIEPQKNGSEFKSQLFVDMKNIDRKSEEKNLKDISVKYPRRPIKKSSVTEEVEKDDNCVVEPKKAKRQTKSEKIKKEPKDEVLDKGINLKELLETKNEEKDSKNKISESLPSCSKDIKEEKVDGEKWEPANWHQLLDNIRIMRSKDNAPVDTMGCHKCADENADEKTQRFHILVALMLSKDDTTYHAMLRLRENNLTPESICEMKVNVLENILHPVSFYKNKAKYLQQTSSILVEKYNSDIPKNIKELVALPGVGPKMAHICMASAWNETTGIGVDVHVHRICNRLQWVPKPTKEPEQTRKALESWLPQNLWRDVNHLLVGFGQTTCTPLKPKCTECLNSLICPSAGKTNVKVSENKALKAVCDKNKFKKIKMHL